MLAFGTLPGAVRAFTVGDAGFFPGIVAMVNSLRITGSEVPVTVLDAGLTPRQRALLEPHCDLIPVTPSAHPALLKTIAPLQSDCDIAVLIDSDIVVTDSLAPAVAVAKRGQVFAYVDRSAPDRWFAEWGEIFELRAPLRRQPAVNAGLVAFSRRMLPELLTRWSACIQGVVDRSPSVGVGGVENPVWLGDQDALNALLMSEFPEGTTVHGPARGMVIGDDALAAARLVDQKSLECRWGDERVGVIHAVGRPKPWEHSAWSQYWMTSYTRALRRALWGPDAIIRVPEAELPPWLRSGAIAVVEGRVLHGMYAPARVSRPLRRRLGLSPLRRRRERRDHEREEERP